MVFDTLAPRSIDELLQLLASHSGVRFWRGSADARWRLDSTLVRRLRKSGEPSDERSVAFWERDLLDRARHRGFDVLSGVRLRDFELLGLLRHNGAATRLIDFTRSATVALWFATFELPDVSGRLLGIHTDYLAGSGEGKTIGESYAKVIAAAEAYDRAFTWEPPRVSPRVSAQHSQFLYSVVNEYEYGSLRLPIDKPGGVFVVDISPELKQSVLPFLREVLD
ncbi:MAG TPA: FRG domain-containing protein, partial [Acidimicrobiales bacterium]|nr:FRG domain-containing protein [Acidimicrobiales bacterium]